MKRRNADSTKFRKQFHFRKCKFAEGVYGSTFLYLKFLFIWLLIMIADFLLEFRFEFLWPFWLVVRSLHDSFKYQGIIFSLFFALITFFSDLLCYMFLPVQWLFFAASTYVWVQYVWHTEKGVCLPTISLWLLFVYIEASLRLKTLKTIDLCRPFAAHCIGYPMVTLGFGFKSYLSYKLRLKKQKEIQKLNEFYMQLIAKALPLELQLKDKDKFKAVSYEEEISSTQLQASQTSQSSILASICNIASTNTSQPPPQQQQAFKQENKNNKNILASALSFYLNGNQSQQISQNNTQIEELPYIQQKDITNVINKNNFNKNDLINMNNYSKQQQPEFNKSNSFSNYSSSNFKKDDNQVNCNLSSFSISSLAYSTDQSSSSSNNLLLLAKDSLNTESNNSTGRSASSSATNQSTNSTNYLPQNSSNHTNININMTINATAIAAATATATANAPNSTNNSNQTLALNQKQNNQKKFKNKDSNSNTQRANSTASSSSSSSSTLNGQQQQQQQPNGTNNDNELYTYKDEMINKLEEDLKKLRLEIQQQKSVEQYLRNQINYITKCDRTEKLKLERLQQENKTLQTKLNKTATQTQKDKDEIETLEKKLQEEKQLKTNFETELNQEKKLREEQQSKHKQQSSLTSECSTDSCKNKLKEYENENKRLIEECRATKDRILLLECDIKSLAKYRENESRVDTLMVALNLMEDKNTSLQESLSAETRFKLDLFSALGETRRQLESVNFQLKAKERELNTFKTILKQSLTNSNSTSEGLSLSLNDVIHQLNSANLLNTTNGLNSSLSNNDLYSLGNYITNQQQQQQATQSNNNGNLSYLPKI